MIYTVSKKFFFYFLLSSFCLPLSSCFAQIENEDIKTGPQTTVVTLTIEVPNEYLQSKSILEAATIYGVDSKILAQKISEHYFNKFEVQELDDITNLQNTHGVNIDDIKEIAKGLQNIYPATPQQKETLVQITKENKILTQREFVFRSVVAILCLYFLSYFLTYRELIHHNIHKRLRNTLLLISFVGYAIIILSYLLPQIYSVNMQLGLDIIYHNLRIGFIIIFLGFSHALRYLFHYRPLKRKLHHKLSQHTPINHQVSHKTAHKTSHSKHPAAKLKKIK
ncbi:MAG: hypothetical protein WAZ12_02760 [Candidatus Absconditicoccaceae bacterium]